ncbi:hypothetical protein HOK68_03850 [Candidatus Woesearchaeota archaeon]|jgi:hypothetical protein|nr:hypothetical protein [Candidatus Woesearchaeota archaeon]MBT4387890.1 hypothetical protein [Candidatus Woesearchaeota archaeon]MBT4595709.1 hypothetical protein [Candidatus Woesearchaeota archaeon]MBT5741442.1 hypothetical protein [Candidatus Woesearchaeota archaeon]MBT6505883.1 hypothetical protein [Candidatus Woesearchaeota archaeon]
MDFELEIRKYQKRLILKPNDNEMDFDILRSTHPKHTQKLDFSFLSNIILHERYSLLILPKKKIKPFKKMLIYLYNLDVEKEKKSHNRDGFQISYGIIKYTLGCEGLYQEGINFVPSNLRNAVFKQGIELLLTHKYP